MARRSQDMAQQEGCSVPVVRGGAVRRSRWPATTPDQVIRSRDRLTERSSSGGSQVL